MEQSSDSQHHSIQETFNGLRQFGIRLLTNRLFWIGWLVRLAFLTVWVLYGLNGPDIQDMNEIIYEGLVNLLNGVNPYGQTYELTTLGNNVTQAYFNYPPLALLLHLPTIFMAGIFQPLGSMDLLLGFVIIHLLFDAATYLVLVNDHHSKLANIFWINPLLIYMDVMTFLSLPIFFITVICAKIDSPRWAILASTLGASVYQYVGVFLPAILIYHRKQPKKLILPLLLGLLVNVPFFLFNPQIILNDLVFAQIIRGYESWTSNRYNSPTFFAGSIPSIIYNITGGEAGGLQIGPIVTLIALVAILVLLLDTWRHSTAAVTIMNGTLMLVALLLSSTHGSFHYWLIGLVLPVYIYHNRRNLQKTNNHGQLTLTVKVVNKVTSIWNRVKNTPRTFLSDSVIGLLLRLITMSSLVILALNFPNFPDINDMNEKVLLAVKFLVQGINPYGQVYLLGAVADVPRWFFEEAFFHYTPLIILGHLPAIVFPFALDGLGFMDFMPSMVALHFVFDYLAFRGLYKRGHKKAAFLIWANPLMIIVDIVTFLSLPFLFMVLGLADLDDPFKSTLWFGLATASYQFAGIFLVFVMFHHRKALKRVLLGLIPSIIIIGAFQIWAMLEGNPFLLLNDLLFTQFGRDYVPWETKIIDWIAWAGSLPAILYNISIYIFPGATGKFDPFELVLGVRFTTIMIGTTLVSWLYFLIRSRNKSSSDIVKYGGIIEAILAASTPHGLIHYWMFAIIPLFWYVYLRREKNKDPPPQVPPINAQSLELQTN